MVLERGWRLREILKQPQYKPIPVAEQVAAILAVTSGQFDAVAVEDIRTAEDKLRKDVAENQTGFCSASATERIQRQGTGRRFLRGQETAVCFGRSPNVLTAEA